MSIEDVPRKEGKRRLLGQPSEVVQRWLRIKFLSKASKLARTLLRLKLPITERQRQKALEDAFNTIKNQTIRFEHSGFHAMQTVFNIALYFLIAERDIQSVKIDALTHPNEWTRKLCARIILLTIHEWDMDKVSGKELKTALETIGVSDELKTEAAEALRAVRLVQRRARREFGFLRNAAIAHRDPNALIQYRAIRNLRTQDVFQLSGDFYAAAGKFIDLLPKIMIAGSTFSALLRQWGQTNAKSD